MTIVISVTYVKRAAIQNRSTKGISKECAPSRPYLLCKILRRPIDCLQAEAFIALSPWNLKARNLVCYRTQNPPSSAPNSQAGRQADWRTDKATDTQADKEQRRQVGKGRDMWLHWLSEVNDEWISEWIRDWMNEEKRLRGGETIGQANGNRRNEWMNK